MKVLFIYTIRNAIRRKYPLKGQEDIQMGISYISALLKREGHSTSLLVLDWKFGKSNFRALQDRITNFAPSLVCFTAVNSEIDFIINLAGSIKKKHPGIFLLLGGVHVTLNPRDKYLDLFNAFCVGEGELPTLELVTELQRQGDISNIANLWIKQGDTIIRNPSRPFLQNLDDLPFADREIWQEWILEPQSRQVILLGRGCPYNCTYCCNHKLRKTASGKYVRLRSPRKISEELSLITAKNSSSELFLEIETLGVDLKWLIDLCTELKNFNDKRETKASFSANLRIYPGMDAETIFSNLKAAGFKSVTIGLESGSERIRKEVLNRDYSNENILQAVSMARKYGIGVGIFNLIGLPGETPDDFQETLRMNRQIQPDWHATSIFYPYEGTELFELVKNRVGIAAKLNPKHERQKARIDYPEFPRKQIQKYFDSFHYEVYKISPGRSYLKLIIYRLQCFTGHHFMAASKILALNLLSRIKIRSASLLTIFQKS